ncbi:MAG: addiction module protein [Chlorobium sp.]
MKTAIPALAALTPAEKLQLIEELWEELSATPEEIPVPQWQLDELDRRRSEYAKNPSSGIPWEEVKRNIVSRHEQ